MDGNTLAGEAVSGRTKEYDGTWSQATPWSGAVSLMPVPFLLLFPQVTGRNGCQQVSVPTQPCPSCLAVHGNIYSGLYHIYPHSVCWFPLPSCADSIALGPYPLEHLSHSPAARAVVSVWELCFSTSWRIQNTLKIFCRTTETWIYLLTLGDPATCLCPKIPQTFQRSCSHLECSLWMRLIITVLKLILMQQYKYSSQCFK